MSNNKYLQVTLASLTVTLLLFCLFPSISPVSAQISVPRAHTLCTTGYDVPPTSFCPVIMDWGQGFDTYIMYEPMFGTNAATGDLICWLGQSIIWVNSTTIEVTLRDDIYWTDGLPITSEDVQYSYFLYGAFDESPTDYGQITDLAPRIGSMSNFEIVSPQVFRVHIKPEYANSEIVWRRLIQSFLIFPKHVWTEIAGNYTYIPDFANDWQDPSTPDEWKVASGMYLPYWHDDVQTIMKRNEDWWGIQVFGRKPYPDYICDTTYESNIQKSNALLAGDTDWSGDYIPGMPQIEVTHPNLHTFSTNPPYFADALAKILVPNDYYYPLNEPWLHKAIAYCLNFTELNLVCSNYLKPASPLYIPADDAVARKLLNTTIEAKYAITTNTTKALQILNQYCTNVGGTWYTKEGPSADYLDLYSDIPPPLGYGNWLDYYKAISLHGDGVNIPLGPWNLIDVSGWTDTNAITAVIQNEVGNALGIFIDPTYLDFDTYVSKMDTMDFDFSLYCMEAGFNNNMYQRYAGMFTGPVGCWGHYGDYRNSTLVDLLDSLDTVPAGTPEQQNIANQIQEIIGSEMPFVPVAGAPDWYIYNEQYFGGWPNEAKNTVLPSSPYGGSGQVANVQTIILMLRPRGAEVGDLGGGVPPAFFAFDGKIDGKDLSLFLQCYKGTAPLYAMYPADLGGGVPPAFYQYDGLVDGKDLALFLRCYHGSGPTA